MGNMTVSAWKAIAGYGVDMYFWELCRHVSKWFLANQCKRAEGIPTIYNLRIETEAPEFYHQRTRLKHPQPKSIDGLRREAKNPSTT